MIRREAEPHVRRQLRLESGVTAALGSAAASTAAAEELGKVADLCGRLDLGRKGADLARTLLEPIAAFVRAETASLRCLRTSAATGVPSHVASLGIPRSVDEAYLARYFRLDPSRRLPRCSFVEPVFADPDRLGVWTQETLSPAALQRYRKEFAEYRNGFLIPSDFVHHVGFSVRNSSSQILVFDFHRGHSGEPFSRCEAARARAVARYLYARALNDWACIDADRSRVSKPDDLLSARELAVAEAVAGGLSNKEVAASFGISVRTVENHLRSIFEKLGVNSRTRLAMELRRMDG